MKKERYNVTGMSCAACSSRIENNINKLNGVKSVSVNLLTNSMQVEYDESIISSKNIINEVVNTGYNATLENSSRNNNSENKDKINNNDSEIRNLKNRFIISLCFLIPLMYIAMFHMFKDWFSLPVPSIIHNLFHGEKNSITFAFSQFLLVLPIMYVNRKYFINGFKALFKRNPNMDSLIAIGAGASVLYGVFAIFRIGYGLGTGSMDIVNRYNMDLYFESAGMILTLITLGKYLETKSKGKTSEAITKLMNLSPKKATIKDGDKEKEILVEDIKIGDTIIIKPGNSIPVDGVITKGASSIDQSAITGESIPVYKSISDEVISATINKSGYFEFEVTKTGENTTINKIIKLVEEASASKAPIAKLADKISGIFVPFVILIAFTSMIIWLVLGASFEFALSIAIAVLVISCPCALGLATPVAIMVGTGKGAENGILIKSGEALEIAHSIDTVVLDKTGTITKGTPSVSDVISFDISENDLLKIAISLEKSSEHPLSEAIINYGKDKGIDSFKMDDFEAILGRGVKGRILEEVYYGGNKALMEEIGLDIKKIEPNITRLADEGKTPLIFANTNNIIGIIAVVDEEKESSKQAIVSLEKMGIDVVMLTGDNKRTANAIKNKLGINKVIAEVLPEEKEKEITKLQNENKKVAMVGDGINDAPALMKSDVGIAIGAGTDIAIDSADIILMKNDLLDVVTSIKLSKAVIKNIKENLFWAFFYNSIGIPIAAGLFYSAFSFKLSPMIGAAAMSLSSVCVVSNALRLKLFKKENRVKNIDLNVNKENKINKKEIKIEGMSCNHCVSAVTKALDSIDYLELDSVNLKQKNAIVMYKNNLVLDKEIKEKIKQAGFKVTHIKNIK